MEAEVIMLLSLGIILVFSFGMFSVARLASDSSSQILYFIESYVPRVFKNILEIFDFRSMLLLYREYKILVLVFEP